ncbi:hypothetical protein [Solidesulfovibrio sp.]|uniref:hypothetical protein n=1 Tax=Solidesulfovibrio sp. TaxID=2910990 RepID=UPI002B20A482|nr:hypothetical protein [Solidesulfovibrio sp.]MEA5089398.1 hypothetical protein [Solidesulfovibrio sp.]
MAYKTLSRNKQKLIERGTPGAILTNRKNHVFRVEFDMPLAVVLKIADKVILTCKECGRSLEFTKESLQTLFSLYTKMFVVFKKLTKQNKCCSSYSFRIDYVYKKLTNEEIQNLSQLIKERKMPTDVDFGEIEREVAIVHVKLDDYKQIHLLHAKLIDFNTREILFVGTVEQILNVVNDPINRYRWGSQRRLGKAP